MFRVGQKVVCVNGCGSRLVKGDIYTVSCVDIAAISKLPVVWLSELGPRPTDGGWYADRFRPIVERKTDISAFKKMLTPSLEDMRELIRESTNA